MRPVLFSSAAGAQVSFTPELDANVLGFICGSGQAILTTDPTLTYSGVITTPTTTGQSATVLLTMPGNFGFFPAGIPVEAGRTYYLTFKAAGVIQLFFDN